MTTPSDDRRDPVPDPGPADPVGSSNADGHGERAPEPTERRQSSDRPATREGQAPLPEQLRDQPAPSGSRTAGIWIALILGAIVLIALLIFVIQNNSRASFVYFTATFQLPLGVAMLLAAIAGALVMALVGSVRMIQMSMQLRRLRKTQNAMRSFVNGH